MSRSKPSSPTIPEPAPGGSIPDAAALARLLREAATAAPTGMVVADPDQPDCPVVWVNPAFSRITGYAAEEVLGRNCRFLQGPGTSAAAVQKIRRAIATREAITIELVNHRRDGRRFVNELHISPSFDADGRLIAFIGIQHDVTERRRAHEALVRAQRRAERANREKSDFLAFMSHEIRTPLHGVMGTMSLLLDTALDAEQRAYAETAERCAQSLLVTVNDLLDLSRIEAGKLVIEKIPFALEEPVREVLDLIAPAAAEKGLALSARLDPALPARLVGDPQRLKQVMLNLADNAVKFTGQGSVEIRLARLPDERLGIAVADTGIGIAPRAQARLFQRFAQADASVARRHGGSGLGLAICKRLVTLMGGRIAVDSTPGKGSIFFFDLPLQPVARSGAPPARLLPGPVPPDAPPRARGRILLAEDGEANQLVAAAILRKAGYTLDVARDGAEAVAAVQSSPYDLVLMDVRMPVKDGVAATAAIRAIPGPRGRVPIIAMTAAAGEDDRERCLAAGMDGHLPKPVDRARLLATVTEVLEGPPRRLRAVPPPPDPGSLPPLLDRETLEELRAAVGPGRLPRLIGVFRRETEDRMARLAGMAADQLHRIAEEAHALKAAAGTFGAAALRHAAAALEASCRSGDEASAMAQLRALPDLATRSLAAFPGTVVDSAMGDAGSQHG